YAYRLIANVKSGEEITFDKVESVLVTEKAVPVGAFASKTKIEDSKGNFVFTNPQNVKDASFNTFYNFMVQ
ncbi:MAG: hypothetical protein IKW81_07120, partial [Pseudobutyrivibrio sp.]|nr:hypothetical protein [Pseudobutyrivibrio sp.]